MRIARMKSASAAITLFLLTATAADACTLARATVQNMAARLESAAEVFMGTVVAVDVEPDAEIGRVRFSIGEIYKGKPAEESWYHFERPSGASCGGWPAKIGYQAIIFIWRDPWGRLWAGPQFGLGTNRDMMREAMGAIDGKKP